MNYSLALLILLLSSAYVCAYECNYDYRGSLNPNPQTMDVQTSDTPRRLKIFVDTSSSLLTAGTYCSSEDQDISTFGQQLKCIEGDVLSYSTKLNRTLAYLARRVENELSSLVDISNPVESITIPSSKAELLCAETVALNKTYIPTKWIPVVRGYDVLFFVTLSPMVSRPTFIQSAVCRQTVDGRPLIGVLNISPSAIKTLGDIASESALPAEFVDMIKHEIIHFLGFNKDTLSSFIHKDDNGKPYIEGTDNTLTKMAQDHFGTDSAKVYLEEEKSGTEQSHLRKKYFNGDVMSSGSGTVTAVSSFTASVLSLLSYYTNPGGSVLPWGRQEAILFTDQLYKQCETGEYGCSYAASKMGVCVQIVFCLSIKNSLYHLY